MIDHFFPGGAEVALVMLGGKIPAIGPLIDTRQEAVSLARCYMKKLDALTDRSRSFQIMTARQTDGRYALFLQGEGVVMKVLSNIDELLFWRFRKAFRRGLFILTVFFKGEAGMECLAVTEGLGAVIFTPS
ncbi:hypothetical protein G7K71_06435 [Desulfofundulus sp. TPOSR]|uniref:Roadblock/LAMTOR2 domain-containing protein n=1 Tax=Desulfofundulus kuznetsovii (strain DSM 6115 / VKM B-1805 / 17) TaxID=760568 RepID=A0AAU8PKK1_DESK7|nr:hypothetical protein [Desulfofundulus sp. TPOSR]AEG13722.1 hypothetical protein Desku_0074 [Desulfofundulus kuznetsovii DSM 6115]NHM26632.1 hypothetical protein [Desulfofundulus sp. TPOSR]